MKQSLPRSTLLALGAGALLVLGALLHFGHRARRNRLDPVVYGNDQRIQKELGLDCGRFEAAALIGRKQGDLAALTRLDNTVLLSLETGSIATDREDGEFLREVRDRTPAADPGRLPTRLFRICGHKIIAIFYGDEIVDTIFVPADRPGRLFGVDP